MMFLVRTDGMASGASVSFSAKRKGDAQSDHCRNGCNAVIPDRSRERTRRTEVPMLSRLSGDDHPIRRASRKSQSGSADGSVESSVTTSLLTPKRITSRKTQAAILEKPKWSAGLKWVVTSVRGAASSKSVRDCCILVVVTFAPAIQL